MSGAAWTRIAVLAIVVLAGLWLASATEWVEREVDRHPRGEAATNPFFALQQLLVELGVRVERRESLEALPPAGATLLLHSFHWDLFPQRAAQLRAWVEAGGHLVLPAALARDDALDWVPVRVGKPRQPPPPASPGRPPRFRECRPLHEAGSEGLQPVAPRVLCAPPSLQDLQPAGATPLWQLRGPLGTELLRVPVGRGTVTVHAPFAFMHNKLLLRADNPLLAAAALQLRSGGVVWLVAEERRPALPALLWEHGRTAILLAAAALLAWLWRHGVRFGPAARVEPPERRSMREQLSGTGAFLRRHGPAALHAAQLRALQEAARARLPGYAALDGEQAVAALAQATGLDAAALRRALHPGRHRRPSFPATLALLEEARRRLLHTSLSASAPTRP